MTFEKITYVLRKHRCYTVIVCSFCVITFQKKLWAETVTSYVIKPYVESTLKYDANLLRLPKNYTPEMSGGRTRISDFIKQARVGAAVKWKISQQELIADVSVNRNWFDNFNILDYTGYDLFGRWNWTVGRRLKGDFSYSHYFNLAGFQQINRLLNNFVNHEQAIARGSYEIVPDWYLHGSFLYDYTHFPGELRQQSDLISTTQQFGLIYENELNNSVDLYVKLAHGKYPNREVNSPFGNEYFRSDYLLRGVWNYSVKTRIRTEIGYVTQEFPNIKDRNFSNIVANADVLWQPTVKSKLLIEVWRNISAINNLVASFSLSHGVRVTPTWTWSETPKLQLELPTEYELQNSVGSSSVAETVSSPFFPSASQFSSSLNINYEPIPNIKIKAFATYESRNADDPNSTYQDHLFGILVQGSF